MGWYLLFSLIGLLITMSVWFSFVRSEDGTALESKQLLFNLAGAMAQPDSAAKDASLAKLVPTGATAPNLGAGDALMLLGIERESKKPLPAKTREAAVKWLKESWYPADRIALEVYDSKPTTARALQISQLLPMEKIYKPARVHAAEIGGDKKLRPALMGTIVRTTMIFGAIIVFAIALGILVWLIYFMYGDKEPLATKAFPIRLADPGEADWLAFRAFLCLCLLIGMQLFPLPEWVMAFAVIGSVIGVACLRLPGPRVDLKTLFGPFRSRYILWAIGAELALVPLATVAVVVSSTVSKYLPDPSHPATDQLAQSQSLTALVGLFLLAVVQAPIVEEIIFRGMLAPAIGRVTSASLGILASSLLFASIHPQGIAGWLPLMVIGVMAAMASYHTKSLWPAVIMHAIHNGALMIFNLWLF